MVECARRVLEAALPASASLRRAGAPAVPRPTTSDGGEGELAAAGVDARDVPPSARAASGVGAGDCGLAAAPAIIGDVAAALEIVCSAHGAAAVDAHPAMRDAIARAVMDHVPPRTMCE